MFYFFSNWDWIRVYNDLFCLFFDFVLLSLLFSFNYDTWAFFFLFKALNIDSFRIKLIYLMFGYFRVVKHLQIIVFISVVLWFIGLSVDMKRRIRFIFKSAFLGWEVFLTLVQLIDVSLPDLNPFFQKLDILLPLMLDENDSRLSEGFNLIPTELLPLWHSNAILYFELKLSFFELFNEFLIFVSLILRTFVGFLALFFVFGFNWLFHFELSFPKSWHDVIVLLYIFLPF
jgi:hypothetical protein